MTAFDLRGFLACFGVIWWSRLAFASHPHVGPQHLIPSTSDLPTDHLNNLCFLSHPFALGTQNKPTLKAILSWAPSSSTLFPSAILPE